MSRLTVVLLGLFVCTQAVEGDCDVVLKKVGGVLTVTAFKCKTEGKAFSSSLAL